MMSNKTIVFVYFNEIDKIITSSCEVTEAGLINIYSLRSYGFNNLALINFKNEGALYFTNVKDETYLMEFLISKIPHELIETVKYDDKIYQDLIGSIALRKTGMNDEVLKSFEQLTTEIIRTPTGVIYPSQLICLSFLVSTSLEKIGMMEFLETVNYNYSL